MYEQVCYRKSFLKQVIAKVDFASPISQLEKGVSSKLLNAIIKNFPIIEPSEIVAHEISFQENAVNSKQTKSKQWNYFGKDRGKQLTLAPQSIFVSYSAYTKSDEVKEQFGQVIEALAKVYPDTKASRFGLRYINEIEFDLPNPIKWDEYVDPKLLGSIDFFVGDDQITRLISIAEINYDDINVRFQYGMPNPDYPAPVKRPLFILDLDASVSQAHDLSEVMPYMDDAHDRIQALFERSITDSLREKMDVEPVQQ